MHYFYFEADTVHLKLTISAIGKDTDLESLCKQTWRAMMKFIYVTVAVLSLTSIGQSAPVSSCETLIQTTEISGTEQLLGKWMAIAESTNLPASKILTKMFVETVWSKITAANESDAITAQQYQKVLGRCFTVTVKMTLANSTLSMVEPYNASEVMLNTRCPDCLVLYSKYTLGANTYRGLQLLSRRKSVTAAELADFKKQVECLNLPAPAVLDSEKGFCPDESASPGTETTDLTSAMKSISPQIFSMIERITDTEGGMQMLSDMITSSLTETDDDY